MARVEGCSLAPPQTQRCPIGCPKVTRPSRGRRLASWLLATVILTALWAPAGAEPVAVPNVAPGQQSPAKSPQAATASPPAETCAVDSVAPPAAPPLPPSPPMTPKAREAANIERLDSLIAPLSKYDLPADDAPK